MPNDVKIRVNELHTIRKSYKDKKYFTPLPHYDTDLDNEGRDELIQNWTQSLADEINNKPHHPKSDIMKFSPIRSKMARQYSKEEDGEEGQNRWRNRYLAEKDSSKWATFEDFISKESPSDNRWINSGVIGSEPAKLGAFSTWDYSSWEFIEGMITNKVNEANRKGSKHFVGKQGEKSRIFDLLNGYYHIAVEDANAIAQVLPFTMQFIKKLNTEPDYLFLREKNPNTGNPISPNQEEIQYLYENPNDIYQTDLTFQVLQEIQQEVVQEIDDFDLDLVIKYWLAQEKLQRGEVANPSVVINRVMGFFKLNGSYRIAFEKTGKVIGQLPPIITDSQNLLDEINEMDDDELKSFIEDNKSRIELVRDFITNEEYVFERIKISKLLNLIEDENAQKALAKFRPPASAGKDKGGQSVADKLKDLVVGEENYLIWITNDPLQVICQNTSQAWGQRTEELWTGNRSDKAGKSCINFNGLFGSGPYFDFYNGNGVAYVARIDEDTIQDYMSVYQKNNKKKFPNLDMSPEELFNSDECEIIGRMSLRWGNKTNLEGSRIGWGVGLETTIYPKSQNWAINAFQGVARILKEVRDNAGNSIWDSSVDGEGNPMQKIKAPYKMGWAYLDYNGTGYSNSIPQGDYDCNGLGASNSLVPNYNRGLRFDADSSTRAQALQLQEGIEIDYQDFVRFDFRTFQEITQSLISDIRLYGSIDPTLYRTVAQNPQIWVSETSLAQVINGLISNTRQEQYQSIRKDFLTLALDSCSKNISWLLQYPKNEISIAGTLDIYDTSKTWNWGENCLLRTIYNHPSVLETFKGHTPDISIQEHLYNQKIKLIKPISGNNFAMASDVFLLDLSMPMGKAPARFIDNAILTDMIKKLKSSAKGLSKLKDDNIMEITNIFPSIDLDWEYWGRMTEESNIFRRDSNLLLAYYQLKVIHNLSYSPLLSTTNYKGLCEVMGIIYKFLGSAEIGPRNRKAIMNIYYRAYKSLTMNLLYDKSYISSRCYSENTIFNGVIQPQLMDSKSVMEWAFKSLFGLENLPSQFQSIIDSEINRRDNPLSKMVMTSNSILSIEDLQNTICFNAWNRIPMGNQEGQKFDRGYKLYMYYYIYHFCRSPRFFNKVFDSYISFIDSERNLDSNTFELTAILLDTLINDKGNILPNNPYIDNEQIRKLTPYLNPLDQPRGDSNFSNLTVNVFGLNPDEVRDEVIYSRNSVGSDGLSAFIELILGSYFTFAPEQYGMNNLFKLLRTPAQFRLAESAMLKLSLGDYFEDRNGQYIFKVPTELEKISEMELVELIYNDIDAYTRIEEIQSDIGLRLNKLKDYLIIFANNSYIPQTMQSRLILTAQNTNAFSKNAKLIMTTKGRAISQEEIKVHYSDIFNLYGSNIYNEVRYKEIIAPLVENPIIGIPTINQIITYIDESLISKLILSAKFDLDSKELLKQKVIINQTLFDNAPEIILKNPSISDEVRLKLFETYLNNIFKTPNKDMTDSLKRLGDFAYDSGDRFNFRDATDYGKFQSVLQKLNFDNIGMWRGGFAKFGINKFIPERVIREGETICESPIIKQKPQIIIDVNFKPPYKDVFISQDSQFLDEEMRQELEDIENSLEELEYDIQREVEGLGWVNYEEFEQNFEGDMDDEEYENLQILISSKRQKLNDMRELKERKTTIRQSAPIKTTIRYIENKEDTQNGIKLSGRYWDSGRRRMSNKWSEIYPDWNAVYGAGQYGERPDGTPKKWKNQITLVFFDNNPNIGWNPVSEKDRELPKWRTKDEYCDSSGFRNIIDSMIKYMKTPEQNLIPFLLTLTDYIGNSGNFRFNMRRGEIRSNKNINLLSGLFYGVGVGRQNNLDLSIVFQKINEYKLWPYLQYLGNNDSFYTENKIALLMFLSNYVSLAEPYNNLKKPPQLFMDLLYSIDDRESYYQALITTELLINEKSISAWEIDNLYPNFKIDLEGLGIKSIENAGIIYHTLDYEHFIRSFGHMILQGMGSRLEGVKDDISIYATIYKNSASHPNSEIHSFVRNVLLERREDWIEFMREREVANPEAIVQEAEEMNISQKQSLNIDDKKMERYIKLILGGKENAQSNVS